MDRVNEKTPADGVEHVEKPSDDNAPRLEIPAVTWYKHNGLRKLYIMMPVLFLGATINGYDGSLLNGLQTMVPWQTYFDYPTGSRLGLFTAIMNIGGVTASLFSSYIADIVGRRLGVVVGVVILLVGTILQVVPNVNQGMYIAGRFLVGLGSNIGQVSAPLLITELAHPQHRGKLTTIYNTLWYLGSIVAAWTVLGTQHFSTTAAWRIPVGVQAAMPVIQITFIMFLPESPRYLLSKGKGDKALATLVKYHANGDENDIFVKQEFAEISETLELERMHQQDTNWTVFFKTRGNRKRLLLIILTSFFSQCCGNGLVSYYIHDILSSVGISDPVDQSIINGCLQIWSFAVSLGMAFFVDKLGRRFLFITAAVGMLITFSIWTACSAVYANTGNAAAGSAVIAMIFLFYAVSGFAWPGLTVAYTCEILPYKLRAKGVAIGFAFTSGSSVFNQYVNPIGLQALSWKFYFVYIAILIIECLCSYFLFVETKGPTLEEIARLFDGDDADVATNAQIHQVTEGLIVQRRNGDEKYL